MDWKRSMAFVTVVAGLLVGTVPLHSAQLVDHGRCQIEIESNAAPEADPISFDSLTTREQRAVRNAVQSGDHRFTCPTDPTLDYAGDVTSSNTVLYNNTTYTVVTTYDDALFPYSTMKQALTVVLGTVLVGAGLGSIFATFRD